MLAPQLVPGYWRLLPRSSYGVIATGGPHTDEPSLEMIVFTKRMGKLAGVPDGLPGSDVSASAHTEPVPFSEKVVLVNIAALPQKAPPRGARFRTSSEFTSSTLRGPCCNAAIAPPLCAA